MGRSLLITACNSGGFIAFRYIVYVQLVQSKLVLMFLFNPIYYFNVFVCVCVFCIVASLEFFVVFIRPLFTGRDSQ